MSRSVEIDDDFSSFASARSVRFVGIATLLCGNRAQAEDWDQSALEKAYLRWHRIERDDPFTYVRRTVVNQHLSWIRRHASTERLIGDVAELTEWRAVPVADTRSRYICERR
jgi:DNA-directed RNA polymerase specialized sigma24 family protein